MECGVCGLCNKINKINAIHSFIIYIIIRLTYSFIIIAYRMKKLKKLGFESLLILKAFKL